MTEPLQIGVTYSLPPNKCPACNEPLAACDTYANTAQHRWTAYYECGHTASGGTQRDIIRDNR